MTENENTPDPALQEPTPAPESSTLKDDLTFATAPNILTTSRVVFVPIVIALLFRRTPFMDFFAALAFTIAAITDYFDGYLARKQNSESVFGKLMDPLADKFLVVSALCMLQELGRIHPVVVILLICREMAITGLRALASSEGLIIGASNSAKWKTATQMTAIPFLMLKRDVLGIPVYEIGQALLYISLAISLWSAKDYIVEFFRAIRKKRQRKKEARLARKLQSKSKR
ncbi:MAG: CDP-diacylglycerol--glycerol-3-phosphate 3-phosphatidyltransferase [Cryobacterium sp.]|nr:CDP-diacylglycerol--glycerol-3-phosphate 3-phosphatidyltransferase [Oligoflexia bacterium]